METYAIFLEMKCRNLTSSMRSWSEEWLGRAQNFAATHQSEPLPPDTAIKLRRRLIEAGHPDLAAKVLLSMLGELPAPRRQMKHAR